MNDIPTRRLPPGVILTPGNNTFQIQIIWGREGWVVAYPIIPQPPTEPTEAWRMGFRPGNTPEWATMPIAEFLNMLAEEYQLPKVFIATI